METIFEKLGWKKFAGIVIIIMLIFLSLVFFSMQSSSTKSTKDSNPLGNGQEGKSSNEELTREVNAFEYSNEYYSILYPIQYEVIELIPNAPVLSSLELVDDISSNKIQIVVFDREGNTVDSLAPPYQNENFEGKIIRMGDNSGYYFEGGLTDNHHQKVALVQVGYAIVRINLSYAGERNLELESAFDGILESLH